MNTKDILLDELDALAQLLIAELAQDGLAREGTVMTVGPPPYRRLDCDGRALAYVRTRPRKKAVRVDVSSLWAAAARAPRIKVPGASGSATLLIRDHVDLADAIAFLKETVDRTRLLREKRENLERRLRF